MVHSKYVVSERYAPDSLVLFGSMGLLLGGVLGLFEVRAVLFGLMLVLFGLMFVSFVLMRALVSGAVRYVVVFVQSGLL